MNALLAQLACVRTPHAGGVYGTEKVAGRKLPDPGGDGIGPDVEGAKPSHNSGSLDRIQHAHTK
jgi:hypothetical protein